MNNDLIYGKNKLDRIVSVEVRDNDAEIFRELDNGDIVTQFVPTTHYILFHEKLSEKMISLKGDQHYRYAIKYDSWAKYDSVLKSCYQKRVDIMAVRDPKEALMLKDGFTYFKGMKPQDVSILSIDIEDTYGIGETLRKDGKVLLIANTYRKQGKVTKKQFAYTDFKTEGEMLIAWVKWVCEVNPSLIIGHNLYGHDLRVLNYAAQKANIKLALGRNGSALRVANRNSTFRKDGSQGYDYRNMYIYGREIVDTWFLAMKYDVAARREYENYKLKDIIAHEGLEKSTRQHYDASTIAENYTNPSEWAKIKAYNVDDADDPLKYFDLVIPSLFYYAQSVPRPFQQIINSATGSQINGLMVRGYLQQGHSIAKASEKHDFEGAITFGVAGIHKNVFKIDVQSLYPSIILAHKIFNPNKDPQELFLKLVEYFTRERIENKIKGQTTCDRYFKDLSDSQKIAINSMYGFLGAPKVNYNSPEHAALVTRHGREILKQAIKWASGREYQHILSANEPEASEVESA